MFRVFTTAAVALANGESSIVMVLSVEEALAFREAEIGQICMDEISGKSPAGFDFGNSPFEVSDIDFSDKTIIQRRAPRTGGKTSPHRLIPIASSPKEDPLSPNTVQKARDHNMQ